MQPMFESLLNLMKEPLRPERGVQTDSSILLIYPPENELDFREQLVDICFPALARLPQLTRDFVKFQRDHARKYLFLLQPHSISRCSADLAY